MLRGFWRFSFGSWLVLGLVLPLCLTGCDRFLAGLIASPAKSPAPPVSPAPSSEPRSFHLTPDSLVLNVLSDEPCPCPYEATGSLTLDPAAAGQTLSWSVGNVEVATVSSAGLVTALATGTTIVTVESAGWLPATASVEVVDRGGRAAVTLE